MVRHATVNRTSVGSIPTPSATFCSVRLSDKESACRRFNESHIKE